MMGFTSRIFYESLKMFVVLFVFALIPGIPPLLEFEAYNCTPPLPLKGSLAINSKLNNAEKLYDGEIKGPEHLEVYNGALYTTLEGGYVVQIKGNKIVPVVKFGQKCEGLYESELCGRPLGLTFDTEGFMYVADAYYGIFKVNITSGDYVQLVSMNTVIENKTPKMPNSLAVSFDGSVFWSDSSTSHQLHDGLYILLGNGNGRLLRYDPVTKNNTVLIDNIHCANGVALSEDNSFVLVADSIKSRILRYNLKGPKMGRSEVFLDGLPGCPDNIHSNGKGEFYTTLVMDVDESNPGIGALLGPYPLIRKAILSILYLFELPALQLNLYYPNYYTKVYTHWIGSFEMLPGFLTKRTTVIFFNEDGKITKSLHSVQEGVKSISDFVIYQGHYYLGSFSNPYLLRVKAS